MKITIIGSGCPMCEDLYNRVRRIVLANNIDAEIEYIKDINELVNRGIAGSPALLIDDEPVFVGKPESDEQLLKLINKQRK